MSISYTWQVAEWEIVTAVFQYAITQLTIVLIRFKIKAFNEESFRSYYKVCCQRVALAHVTNKTPRIGLQAQIKVMIKEAIKGQASFWLNA